MQASDKLRLLLVLPGVFSAVGGIEAFNRLLIRAATDYCAAHGGRVRVLALNDHPDAFDPAYGDLAHVHFSGFKRDKGRFLLRYAEALTLFRPHGILFGHTNLAPLGLVARSLSRAWQWFFVHGIEAWDRLRPDQRLALAGADRILAVSRFTLEETARSNGLRQDHMTVFPNTLDPAWIARTANLHPDVVVEPRRLLTVTRLAPASRGKGVDTVLRALPQVLRELPDVRYVVVGDGQDRPRLEALALELGLGDVVTFAGRVDDRELDRQYRQAGVFIMPSKNEGFGIVFLEAGWYGKPSIAGDYAGAREAVVDGETGYLVPQDPAEVADRILRLMREPGQVERMGAAAHARVRELHLYEPMARRLARHLDQPRGKPPET